MRKSLLAAALATCGLMTTGATLRAAPVAGDAAPAATTPGQLSVVPVPRGAGVARVRPFERLAEALDTLNLTDAQKAQAQTILSDARTTYKNWFEANKEPLKQLRDDMQKARQENNPVQLDNDRAQLRQLLKNSPHPKEVISQLAAILTPDQKAKFDQMVRQFRQTVRGKPRDRLQGQAGQP